MGYFLNYSFLEKIIKKNGGSIVVTDPKVEYLHIKEQLHKPNIHTIFSGVVGKGSKTVFFAKEKFKPELAPQEATIVYLTIDGNDYVKMSY